MNEYPSLITSLPLADLPLQGATGWLLQGETRQAVFLRLEPGTTVPAHHHGAQWGVVLDGELELTIGGRAALYRRGDSYAIAAGEVHSARCDGGALALDVFADPDRYRAMSSNTRGG